ncbi:uncharacterized protein IL334_004124 [Kwoniella shivajii]|uniref:Uncharacterized protein n=1 Tax=Kwoniella shivajii TaxID=564305 RepID=A0ABZ1CZK3_9TREE|nr:hypothetical protein IL334_004124 [Kwoniella shivajii]
MRSIPDGDHIHPFLKGNFAPVTDEYIAHTCDVVYGEVPLELKGGQYIRNGGNPVYPPEQGRHYHCLGQAERPAERRRPLAKKGQVGMVETFRPEQGTRVIDRAGRHVVWKKGIDIGRAKMMHDFAATRTHTILLNLPLTLSPNNLFSRHPVPLIHFDRTLPSEFVIFPRLLETSPIKFQEPEPSLIFHTANAWDEFNRDGKLVAVNMLGCRFKTAKLVYAAGAVAIPEAEQGVDDVVRLHYYRFNMTDHTTHSFPLSAIPFEFPSLPHHLHMSPAKYIYGCTMRSGSFDERLGGAAKVDCIAKMNIHALVKQPDSRSSAQILQDHAECSKSPIEIFALPEGWFAQEAQFVPRVVPTSEDDGFLLTYADGTPSPALGAGSELWIIDARRLAEGMNALVARVKLPQRVPYG